MRRNLSRISTPALFSVALVLGACKVGDTPADILAKDSTLTRDLALANTDTSAQPELKDVPVATVQANSEPAPVPRISRQAAPEILTPRRESRPSVVRPRETPPVESTPVPPANTTANG